MRFKQTRARLTTLAALLVAVSCATPVTVRFGTHTARAPVVAISNPTFEEGDPLAGRRAFVGMQCIDCHRVAEDPALPRGRRAVAGPELRGLGHRAPQEVARRITSRETGAGEALFDRTMKDYAQPLTARQLVDIVAYLRSPKLHRG